MKIIRIFIICFLFLAGASACKTHTAQTSRFESNNSAVTPVEASPQGEEEQSAAGGMEESTSAGFLSEENSQSLYSNSAELSWLKSYADYLNDDYFHDFYVGDINCDGIPEVVIRYNHTNSGAILSFTNGSLQVLELLVDSTWGQVGYLEKTGQIIFLQWYGHTTGTFGSVNFYIYEWTPDGYIETRSVIRESGYYANDDSGVYGQGFINGEEVDFDAFETELAEMYQLLEKSRWFPMTEASEVGDFLGYLMQWERTHFQE